MAVSGGPDEETWKKMSPNARKIYWILVGVVWVLLLTLFTCNFFELI
ncbi:hypothetical protein BH11PSE12_BH11PSE12_34850 [soil metagenome]